MERLGWLELPPSPVYLGLCRASLHGFLLVGWSGCAGRIGAERVDSSAEELRGSSCQARERVSGSEPRAIVAGGRRNSRVASDGLCLGANLEVAREARAPASIRLPGEERCQTQEGDRADREQNAICVLGQVAIVGSVRARERARFASVHRGSISVVGCVGRDRVKPGRWFWGPIDAPTVLDGGSGRSGEVALVVHRVPAVRFEGRRSRGEDQVNEDGSRAFVCCVLVGCLRAWRLEDPG